MTGERPVLWRSADTPREGRGGNTPTLGTCGTPTQPPSRAYTAYRDTNGNSSEVSGHNCWLFTTLGDDVRKTDRGLGKGQQEDTKRDSCGAGPQSSPRFQHLMLNQDCWREGRKERERTVCQARGVGFYRPENGSFVVEDSLRRSVLLQYGSRDINGVVTLILSGIPGSYRRSDQLSSFLVLSSTVHLRFSSH